MEKTPRKSSRLNKSMVVVDSPPISCSRPSGRTNECIVINSSSSYKVQQKDDYGADTKSKGKEKLLEDHYPHDRDFEDEIPLSKRLRVNNDQDLKNVDGGSVSKGMNGLSQKWTRLMGTRLRFGALLWEYGKMKIDIESVSEDEASKQGGRSNRWVKE
ncbi:hypothetical protein H5410_057258 [Solanum commersonii]|uniref:Uncharacterized protein n=1 Tax=Solanum commersonii TaxID=4109 RepID=A0A9J5WPM3_SOLCO|nr:hypothetical protein H5410_057258 [Solanum commersonii]